MLVVFVDVYVKPENIDQFIEATKENVKNSQCEPGIYRFELVQDREDPTHFVLIEVYRNEEATLAHKQTAHYQTWRETVESMMRCPRKSTKYSDVYPIYH